MAAKTQDIRRFALEEVRREPGSILAGRITGEFGISRQAASNHLKQMVAAGLLALERAGRENHYRLADTYDQHWSFPREALREDVVWRERIAPALADLAGNVKDIWHYGVTEMVNNAVDHSEGMGVWIRLTRNALETTIQIGDDGEGIFHRIQRLLGFYDPREAILELAKGKLTTDPANHTGEGIFFSSRMFDFFSIMSRTLYFSHRADCQDWLIDDDRDMPGTLVTLTLANDCARTARSVMEQYEDPAEASFDRTVVPVRLARHEGEKLVSRSQAKRLASRFERFRKVVLDFKDVEEIGQAFADEIFRVFANAHPTVELIPMNAVPDVQQMINRAQMANLVAVKYS